MKNKLITLIALLSLFLFGCSDIHTSTDNKSEMDSAAEIIDEAVIQSNLTGGAEEVNKNINYSNDPAANEIIATYNEQNPNSSITDDMVELPDNGGVYMTVIHLNYCDFIVSESDGSPSYRCRSVLEINEDNTNGFFNEAYYMIHAVEAQLTQNEILEILDELSAPFLEGEESIYTSAKIPNSKRNITFHTPPSSWVEINGKKVPITYELYWFFTVPY